MSTRGTMLIEIRGTGGQTMMPPSIHPSGEQVRWSREGEPGGVSVANIKFRVGRVAAVTILARHYPVEGSRQSFALAMSGLLLKRGMSVAEVERCVEAVAVAANDEEVLKRTATVA